MSLERPQNFKPSTQAIQNTTKKDTFFVDVPIGGKGRFRLLPPNSADGDVLIKAVQHFGYIEDDRNTALACLREHGTKETGNRCILCLLAEFIEMSGDKDLKYLVQGKKHIRASRNYYAQVLETDPNGKQYDGPKMLRLTQRGADEIKRITAEVESMEGDFYTDIDKGYDLIVNRFEKDPWCTIMRTKPNGGLDKIKPGWDQDYIRDGYAALRLKVYTPDRQYELARSTYGDKINWDAFAKFAGL